LTAVFVGQSQRLYDLNEACTYPFLLLLDLTWLEQCAGETVKSQAKLDSIDTAYHLPELSLVEHIQDIRLFLVSEPTDDARVNIQF
jgi:hypothetical protein